MALGAHMYLYSYIYYAPHWDGVLHFMSALTLEVDTGNHEGPKALCSLYETVVHEGPKALYSLYEIVVHEGPKALLYIIPEGIITVRDSDHP